MNLPLDCIVTADGLILRRLDRSKMYNAFPQFREWTRAQAATRDERGAFVRLCQTDDFFPKYVRSKHVLSKYLRSTQTSRALSLAGRALFCEYQREAIRFEDARATAKAQQAKS